MNTLTVISRETSRKPHRIALLACSLSLLAALGACNKPGDDGKTVGQKVDSAVAKTEQVAANAAAEAKSSIASANEAMKGDVQKAEDSSKQMSNSVSTTVDDVAITASVSTELAKDPDLSALKINVDTKNGGVTLNGPAPSLAAKNKATTLAKSVKGVTSVDNKLVVKAS